MCSPFAFIKMDLLNGGVVLLLLACGLEGFLAINVSMKTLHALPSCSVDAILQNSLLQGYTTVSKLQCSMECGKRDDCLAINVCPGSHGKVQCELLDARAGDCSKLVSKTGCFYKEKDVEDHNPCQNGGTYVYAQPCICLPGWAGYYCHRLVRDCEEAKDSGLPMEQESLIQPVRCPYSFQAFCNDFGNTYFLRRNHPFQTQCDGMVLDPNMDWDGYKIQFGSRYCDYMVGLENLWYILRQGAYDLHLYLQYYVNPSAANPTEVNAYYWNIQMASEQEGYAIQYTGFTPIVNPEGNRVDDGFDLGANTPTRFCTHDRDCGTCAQDSGVAWWYNAACDNFPLTARNGSVYWPIDGQSRRLSLAVAQFKATRYNW